MWFKNLLIFRLDLTDTDIVAKSADFEEKLSRSALQPCGGFEMESRGWISPRDDERFLHTVQRHWLFALGINQKLLPSSVISQTTKERAAALAAKQEHPVGRKQMRDLRERVLAELMPRALSRRRVTRAWIDPVKGWLIADTSADKKADELIEMLGKSDIKLPARRLETRQSPATAMTNWLTAGEIPGHFTIDQDLELRSADNNKSMLRYVQHTLAGGEIRDHIKKGKVATRLGITWKERISFVLTEQLQIKRLMFLEVLKSDNADTAEDAEEQFDADFALMAGELSQMLADLTKALGGEKAGAKSAD